MVIASNMPAVFANNRLNINNKTKVKALERLSTGYKVNRAADDAAGLSISEKMRAQIRGLNRGAKNVQEGVNFCDTAEGALKEVHSILDRIKELAVQAANDTYVSADRRAINEEIDALKKEINRISCQTEYNTIHIFNTGYELEFSDNISAIQIFDANNGDPSDPDSYGGIIVTTALGESTRVAWTEIDPDMVYVDPDTNETVFRAGTYIYDTGLCELTITCKDGSQPPDISVQYEVKASSAGISVAGTTIAWEDVLNEDGKSILDTLEDGYYHFSYGDATCSFYVESANSLQDVMDGINGSNTYNSRKYVSDYSGYYTAQAVDIIDTGSTMRVSNTIYQALLDHDDLDATLQADEEGIYVVDASGNILTDSKKTWAELGITSWDSGADISDTKVYHYEYQNDDYNIQFDFTLLDETSIDSVIQGINNAKIVDTAVITNNTTTLDFTAGNGVLSGTITAVDNTLDVYEEAALGRDFDQQSETIGSEQLTYDADTNQFTLTYYNTDTGLAELEYVSAASSTSVSVLRSNAELYENYLYAQSVKALFGGDTSKTTLEDVLGSDKITSTGHMTEAITIDTSSMNTTKKISDGTYPGVSIDFSGLGTDYQLYDLLGTGFNSTCMTCNNHYSVTFVWDDTEDTTAEGYGYTLSSDGQKNYTLQISVKSLLEQGIETGEDLADALVDIFSDSDFDFHYTQYASSGSTLYICDNRTSTMGSTRASFDTSAYEIDNCTIDIKLQESDSNRSITLQYVYDLTADLSPYAELQEADDGEWVIAADGTLKKYNVSDYLYMYDANGNLLAGYTLPTRYNIEKMSTISSWENYYDNIMQTIADQSGIDLTTTDYASVSYTADELSNEATVSLFDFYTEEEEGFWIQSGANSYEGMLMTWDSFSTYTLGMTGTNTLTRDASSELIDITDKAIEKISEIRATFGAYKNRMEHMYAIDTLSSENLQEAESRIRDADYADEMVQETTADILAQAAQAMLSQANRMQEGILMLLR